MNDSNAMTSESQKRKSSDISSELPAKKGYLSGANNTECIEENYESDCFDESSNDESNDDEVQTEDSCDLSFSEHEISENEDVIIPEQPHQTMATTTKTTQIKKTGRKLVKRKTDKPKRKKKRKDSSLRKNIRKVFKNKELDAMTQHLREKEHDRLKKLGLLSSPLPIPAATPLSVASTVQNKRASTIAPPSAVVICLDSSSDEETAEEKSSPAEKKSTPEVLVLSSDSDDNDDYLNEEEELAKHHSQLGLHTNDLFNTCDDNGRVLVNVQRKGAEKSYHLSNRLSSFLKPHQIGGVRFLYDNLIETVQDFDSNTGNGCILAHSMGLGKTIQTITFVDFFLRHTSGKKVLCVVPVNTIQNWVNEFNRWVPPKPKEALKVNQPSQIDSVVEEVVEDMVQFVDWRVSQELAMLQQQHQQHFRRQEYELQQQQQRQQELQQFHREHYEQLPDQQCFQQQQQQQQLQLYPMQQQLQQHQLQQQQQLRQQQQLLRQQQQLHYSYEDAIDPSVSIQNAREDQETDDVQNAALHEQTESNEESDESDYRSYNVLLIDTQKAWPDRIQIIEEWHENGGVLLIGYEMYRVVANGFTMKRVRGKKSKLLLEERKDIGKALKEAVCDPGPDLVVCDEGHRIRNYQSGISQALKSIKTRKRLVLTGYPIQNNLIEYWCMVDFVRPNYLGSRQEFANMFERPMLNGQCVDSTHEDKRLMRQRAHVLYSLLQGFVQRRDHSVFANILPKKEEHVIMVRLSELQKSLYQRLIELTKEAYNDSLNPIKTFHLCCKIWNHPDILYKALQACCDGNLDLINDEDEIDGDSQNGKPKRKKTLSPPNIPPSTIPPPTIPPLISDQQVPNPLSSLGTELNWSPIGAKELLMDISQWAPSIFKRFPYVPGDLRNSGKFDILNKLIHGTVKADEKMLIFSQSLMTLNAIEEMLQKSPLPRDATVCWKKGEHYFRLDGSTTSIEREKYVKQFNDENNKNTRLFLLSTRAGCLGINLIGANRVVVFDVSWNPCHDAQAVCRIYRYGQTRPCHIYRFVASNTMEKKMYYRQISKQGISNRVVDEMNQTENFSKNEIRSLIIEEWIDEPSVELESFIKRHQSDHVLSTVLASSNEWIAKVPFKHESLLINDTETELLTGSEKRAAKRAYEAEKRMCSRPYPLQQSFPRNSPIAPVKPFLWRPPSVGNAESNGISFPVMLGNQPSASNNRFSNQYLSMLTRLHNQTSSTRPLSHISMETSTSSSNLQSLLLSGLRNSLSATNFVSTTTTASTTTTTSTTVLSHQTSQPTTTIDNTELQSSFTLTSSESISQLAASLMVASDFRTHQAVAPVPENFLTTNINNVPDESPYTSISNFLPSLYNNTPIRYTMEDVNSYLLANQETTATTEKSEFQSRDAGDDIIVLHDEKSEEKKPA